MNKDHGRPFPLKLSRVHEAYGPSAYSFALISAQAAGLPLLWIRERKRSGTLFPEGVAPFLPPHQMLIAEPTSQKDALAVAEEALKDGAVKSVVLETSAPLDLREGRRLQLAAKTGGGLGLCLISENMGSNAAETRWYCAALHDPDAQDSTLMCWENIKNKSGTIGAWHVRWDWTAHNLHMVPAPSVREGAA